MFFCRPRNSSKRSIATSTTPSNPVTMRFARPSNDSDATRVTLSRSRPIYIPKFMESRFKSLVMTTLQLLHRHQTGSLSCNCKFRSAAAARRRGFCGRVSHGLQQYAFYRLRQTEVIIVLDRIECLMWKGYRLNHGRGRVLYVRGAWCS